MSPFRHKSGSPRNYPYRFLKGLMQGILRWLFRAQRQRRRVARGGFVFPTTMMMILVVSLTAAALTVRSANRAETAILARQQQVITNAATPALDRGKAKIEYLFGPDQERFPRKVPTSDMLKTLLMGDETDNDLEIIGVPPVEINGVEKDIYTLADETRIDLDGDASTKDNAWMFSTGVGDQVVVYAITVDDAENGQTIDAPVTLDKALAQVTRNGPISTSEAPDVCRVSAGGDAGQQSEEGWQIVSPVNVEKNIQITAFVADRNDISGTVSTLELQQVRSGDRSSKWGAWFRYDLEVYPGINFNWNGAMHTQGNLLVGNRFNAYMISSKNSCLYTPTASDITVGRDMSNTGFHGQLVRRSRGRGTPIIHSDRDGQLTPDQPNLTADNDSVEWDAQDSIGPIGLDPVALYLSDTSEHISDEGDGWNSTDPNPDSSTQAGRTQRFNAFNGRVQEVDEVLVRNLALDDIFRADNRWGPKANYSSGSGDAVNIPADKNIGEDIDGVSTLTNSESGLDGYWERQAIASGTRWIVGERLELGNVHGWDSVPNTIQTAPTGDPLYPPDALPHKTSADRRKFGYMEQKQRRTLRDNLAAVQGMVAYRWDLGSGTTPQVCIATTAHHGTYQATVNSRTFRRRKDANSLVMTDFLTGNGTNGWEFSVVSPTTGQMNAALTNLARFAGDPKGGAPSFEPVQDTMVHPHPYMAMWGDFSVLRRNLVENEGNDSPADKSNLDVSACTLSLLAYNLDAIRLEHEDYADTEWGVLAEDLTDAYEAASAADRTAMEEESLTPWLASLADAQQRHLQRAYKYFQVRRDRHLGFAVDKGLDLTGTAPDTWEGTYDPATGTYTIDLTDLDGVDVLPYVDAGDSEDYEVSVDPAYFTTYGITDEAEALSLALAATPRSGAAPIYPALYYVFPTESHARATDQPDDEPYISRVDGYDATTATSFAGFTDAQIATIAAQPKASTGTWTLPKGTASSANAFAATWGDGTGDNLPDEDPFRLVVTAEDGTTYSSAFTVSVLDKILYSGRENMALRFLDMDVAKLMGADWFYGKDADREHYGLTYAFREDAVREDEIVRPTATGFGNDDCNTYKPYREYDSSLSGCYMTIGPDAMAATDPVLTDHGISTKPVDFMGDPDRRAYGFRFRNGEDFGRPASTQSGMTFITDAGVIIQGDFNLHGSTGALEEFSDILMRTTPVDDFFDPFYDRADLNLGNFSNVNNDDWRPAEILADSVYVNSDAFKDGFVEAAYVGDYPGIGVPTGDNYNNDGGGGKVSFQNMNILGGQDDDEDYPNDYPNTRPDRAGVVVRENLEYAPDDGSSIANPIYFDRNGEVYYLNDDNDVVRIVGTDTNPNADYHYWGFGAYNSFIFTRTRGHIKAEDTTVNALLIGGIVPSRSSQSYGGLHNFPRMNEWWLRRNLYISGGFYQLFFSHTATGPFDMRRWELTDPVRSDTNPMFHSYEAPNRLWGYDVALQYSIPHPVSLRFTNVGNTRSEFYRELPVDDPYVRVLRCARPVTSDGLGDRLDDSAACTNIP